MEHWSEYWNNSGALNSFSEGCNSAGYFGSIAAYWNSIFAVLPSNSELLDIGTGNGAAAVLANQYSKKNNLSFSITAIDAAKISPLESFEHQPSILETLHGIKFFSEVFIEDTSFKSESFDFLFSQFGYEYSDRNNAIVEILRLLKPNGRFVALCHHKESAITNSSRYGSEVLSYILHKTPIFPVMDVIIKLAQQALPQLGNKVWHENATYQVLKNNVYWLLKEVNYRYPDTAYADWIKDVSDRIDSVFDNFNLSRIADLSRYLAFHYNALLMHKKRLSEQHSVALDDSDVYNLKTFLRDKNIFFSIATKEFEEDTKVWELSLIRR